MENTETLGLTHNVSNPQAPGLDLVHSRFGDLITHSEYRYLVTDTNFRGIIILNPVPYPTGYKSSRSNSTINLLRYRWPEDACPFINLQGMECIIGTSEFIGDDVTVGNINVSI